MGLRLTRTAAWAGLIGASALPVGALGCGGSEPGPRETTEAFFEAVGKGDGAKACEFFTDELLQSGGSKRACARSLTFARRRLGPR